MNRLEIKHEYMKKAAREGFSPFFNLTAFDPIIDLVSNQQYEFFTFDAEYENSLDYILGAPSVSRFRSPNEILQLVNERKEGTVVYLFNEKHIGSGDIFRMIYSVTRGDINGILPVMIETDISSSGEQLSGWLPMFYKKGSIQTRLGYVRYYTDVNAGLEQTSSIEALSIIPDDKLIKKWYKNMKKVEDERESERNKLLQQTKDNMLKKQNEDKEQKAS